MPSRKITEISRLDGGLSVKTSASNLSPSQSDELKNVAFNEFGAVETAKGCTVLSSIGNYPIQGLMSFTDSSSTTRLVAACSGSLYEYNEDSGEFGLISNSSGIYDYTTSVFMSTYKNKLFISDGVSGNYKYDGSELTYWGVQAQQTDVLPVGGASGLLSGTYSYVIFGENKYGARGDYKTSPAYSATVSNQQINVISIPTFDDITGITTVYICRNKADSPGLYYIVDSVSNGTSSYTDNTPDSDLTEEAPTDNGMPPAFIAHVPLKGLMFGLTKDTSNIYYSNLEEPETWSSTDYITVSNGDGLYCKGMSVVGDSLLISKNKDGGAGTLYYLYMPSSSEINWILQKVDSWVGGQAPKAMVPFGNSIMMINRFGIWDISQSSPGVIRPDPISFDIEPFINNLSLDTIDRSSAISWNNKLYISVPYGEVATNNNMVLVYDYVKGRANSSRSQGAWSYLSDVYYNDFTTHNNYLYAGDAVSGVVYKLEDGYNNAGSPIISSYKTAPIFGPKSDEAYTKVWRTAWFLVDTVGDWNLQADAFVDYFVDNNSQILIDTNPSGVWDSLIWESGEWDMQPVYTWVGTESTNASDSTTIGLNQPGVWDSMQWDDTEWDIKKKSKWVRWNLKNCVGKSISFRFRTTGLDNWFRVSKVKVEYFLKGKIR